MNAALSNPLLIRYSEHPAFNRFGTVEDRFEGFDVFQQLDSLRSELLSAGTSRPSADLLKAFETSSEPHFKRLLELLNDSMGQDAVFRPIGQKSLELARAILIDEMQCRLEWRKISVKRLTNREALVAANMRDQGYSILRLPEDRLAEVWAVLGEWRDKLWKKREAAPKNMSSCAAPLPPQELAWRKLKRLFDEAGLPNGVRAGSQVPLDLDYCCLQLSHDDEAWWKDCYADVGLGTSDTSYLHYDHDFALVKAIIYLQPVHDKNAPFSVIPNERAPSPSYARDVYLKQLDCCSAGTLYSDPLCRGHYYRPQFHVDKYRREFARLPSTLRGSSHWGDDVLNGSEQSKWLLGREIRVTSDVGNCVIFKGGTTIHRGGMVQSGERWALQIGFRLRNGSWSGQKNRWKHSIKGLLPASFIRSLRLRREIALSA